MRNIVSHFILTFALFISLSLVLSNFYSMAYSRQFFKSIADRFIDSILTAIWDGITCIEHVNSPSYLTIRVVLPVQVKGCFLRIDEIGYLSIIFGGFEFSIKLPSRPNIVYLPSKVYLSESEVSIIIRNDGEYIYVKLSGL